jgi:hypothetical protein
VHDGLSPRDPVVELARHAIFGSMLPAACTLVPINVAVRFFDIAVVPASRGCGVNARDFRFRGGDKAFIVTIPQTTKPAAINSSWMAARRVSSPKYASQIKN